MNLFFQASTVAEIAAANSRQGGREEPDTISTTLKRIKVLSESEVEPALAVETGPRGSDG